MVVAAGDTVLVPRGRTFPTRRIDVHADRIFDRPQQRDGLAGLDGIRRRGEFLDAAPAAAQLERKTVRGWRLQVRARRWPQADHNGDNTSR